MTDNFPPVTVADGAKHIQELKFPCQIEDIEKIIQTVVDFNCAGRDDRLNHAYSERAYAAAALARMALMNGFKAGTGTDNSQNDPKWRVVLYVDTPAGQVSWHIAPADQWVLEGLPEYGKPWDNTFASRDGRFAVFPVTRQSPPIAAFPDRKFIGGAA